MDLTRRDFLRAAGVSTAAGILFAGCAIPDRELIKQSPRDLPEDLATGLEDWYATSCGVCMEGHGVIVRVIDGRAKKIEGNPDHPTNRGKLLPGCLAGVQALYHPDRLRGPLRNGTATTWQAGEEELLRQLQQADPARTILITRPQRGHLGVVLQAFAQARGIEHFVLEPVEEAVLRAAVRQVFGQERLPFFDVANAASVLSIGADFLEQSASPLSYNVAYGNFRHGPNRARGVHIHAEPRFSVTAAAADAWLPVAPGQEGVLALSIAHVLVADGLADAAIVGQMGGAAALAAYAPEAVVEQVSLTPGAITVEKVREAAHQLADHRPALVIPGGTAAGQTNGLFNVAAALALNGLLGNVGAPGGIVFNPAPPLPELQDPTPPTNLTQWKALKERLDRGEIDLVLVHEANPAYMLESIRFGESLAKASSIVSFTNITDETTRLAGLVLPDNVYLESWGTDVPSMAPGYSVLTVQQPVVPPLIEMGGEVVYDSRPFGDVILRAGRALGYTAQLPWENMEVVVRDALQRLHQTNPGRGSVQGATFEAFWVGVLQRGGWWNRQDVSAVRWTPTPFPARTDPSFAGPTGADSYYLVPFSNSALLDGSGAYLPWLQSAPDPLTSAAWRTWVEVNNREAARRGFKDGDVVQVVSPAGAIEAIVYVHPATPPNVVSILRGRGHSASGRYAEGYGANVYAVQSDLAVQDVGAAAWAATRVTLTGTGRRVRLARFEGGMGGRVLDHSEIIQVTAG
jgi:anaerobic selenocysteine-containing dehydrogenase